MASLKLTHIYKVYENGHKAVNDFNIDIQDKEFIVFVGPSGCGKSTTLRMIAGLEAITAGDLFIGDTLVNDMEPKDRDIAMVFQNYALYPHMTVFENMAFSLRNRHLPEAEIKAKVLEAAKILDIEDYLNRKPKAMSGGQRQRVALGRAIVRDPKVFLLDEPLSNLDAKLRAQMRTEITKLHKKLATTFIYVTHDQVEAMTMGTRIVVMKLGFVQQIDTPMNLYNEPYNKFVAGFIGTPQMNFFNVSLNRKGDEVEVKFSNDASIKVPYEKVSRIHASYLTGEKPVIFGCRPEHFEVVKKGGISCVVNAVEHLGNECIIYGTLGSNETEFTMKDEGKNIIVKAIEGTPINVGDCIMVAPNEDKLHFFDAETEITLTQPIPPFTSVECAVKGNKVSLLGKDVALVPAIANAINGAGEMKLEVPPTAIVPGKAFSLKVHKIEEVNGKHLAYLSFEDHYLFALVDEKVKEGTAYSFDILFDKVQVKVNEEIVLEPIGEEESFVGRFTKTETKEPLVGLSEEEIAAIEEEIEGVKAETVELSAKLEEAKIAPYGEEAKAALAAGGSKEEVKAAKAKLKEEKAIHDSAVSSLKLSIKNNERKIKDLKAKEKQKIGGRTYHFFAKISDVETELPINNGFKMNAVEGNNCYKKLYRFGVDRKKIMFAEEGGVNANVVEVLDYGAQKYARLDVEGQNILVEVPTDFAGETLQLAFNGEDIAIYSIEIDMKIC